MRLLYTRRAIRHLDAIFSWIAVDRPRAAAEQIRRIRHSIDLLTTFPEMGHTGKSVETLELVVPRTSYIVVYRLNADTVQILGVFDGRRRRASP